MNLLIKIAPIRFGAFLPAAVILFIFAGCAAVGPDYVPPDTPMPEAWHNPGEKWSGRGTAKQRSTGRLVVDSRRPCPNEPWLSPRLQEIWTLKKPGHVFVKPVLAAPSARPIVSRPSTPAALPGRAAAAKKPEAAVERELYAAGFDAAWELDVFGGEKRAVEAAGAELQASEEDLRDVLVSLLAEVALNYVELRSFQTRLSVAEANLDAQKETYNITRWRRQAGLTTQLDVEQAKYSFEQTRAQIPGLETGLAQAKNRLAVLIGQHPGSLGDALAERKPIPVTPLEVAVGVPADILRRRPDVRRAERRLAAQTAQIGVATADLYPRFSLLRLHRS